MVSKSKKIVALLLTAMMAATAFAGCGGGETTTSSTAPAASTASTSGDTSASGDASQTQASTTAEAVDLDSADMLQKIKDHIAGILLDLQAAEVNAVYVFRAQQLKPLFPEAVLCSVIGDKGPLSVRLYETVTASVFLIGSRNGGEYPPSCQ